MATPRPQPTAVRKAKGNPGKRPLNEREPQFDVRIPEMPDVVRDYPLAAKLYTEAARLLADSNVITAIDGTVLASYAIACARWMDAETQLTRDPLVLEAHNGTLMPNPLVGIANKYNAAMLNAAGRLGMTPADRTKVQAVGKREPEDPLFALAE